MMKRIVFAVLIVFTLSACSVDMDELVSLIISPTVPPPLPTETPTATVDLTAVNITPTLTIIPTFTSTPTLVESGTGLSADDPDSNPLDDPDLVLPTLYIVPTTTSAPKTSLYSGDSIVVSVTVSSDMLIWGYCDDPHYVDFDVRIAANKRVRFVLLFMRLVAKNAAQSTAWGGGAIMEKVSGSYYTYRVRPENITHYEEFDDAWIQFQVVAASGNLQALGRSPIQQEDLTLKKCYAVETDTDE